MKCDFCDKNALYKVLVKPKNGQDKVNQVCQEHRDSIDQAMKDTDGEFMEIK